MARVIERGSWSWWVASARTLRSENADDRQARHMLFTSRHMKSSSKQWAAMHQGITL